MRDLLTAVLCDAELPAAHARPDEVVEVRASRTRRRKHRITDNGVHSSKAVTVVEPAMIRLAQGGREAHLWTDGLYDFTAGAVLAEARGMTAFGRPFSDAPPLHRAAAWPEHAHVDRTLEYPERPLTAFWDDVQNVAERVGARLCLRVRVAEALITEELFAEAFHRTGREPRSFASTRIEVRLLVEVQRERRRTRLWAARHGGFLSDLPLTDILMEAAFRGCATIAGATPSEPVRWAGAALLLAPRPTAMMLRILANDMFDQPDVPYPESRLSHVLIDDPHANDGGHARPYDHEGSPTAQTVLLDQSGRRARMVGRGYRCGASGDAKPLSGHAYAFVGQGAPSPRPTNVTIAAFAAGPGPDICPESFSGLLGINLRGEGTQRIRAGETIRFRVETVEVRHGTVTGPATTLHINGTVRELVAAIGAVSPTASYLAWRDYSTGCAWSLLPEAEGVTA